MLNVLAKIPVLLYTFIYLIAIYVLYQSLSLLETYLTLGPGYLPVSVWGQMYSRHPRLPRHLQPRHVSQCCTKNEHLLIGLEDLYN